jgi:site-specific recombinase
MLAERTGEHYIANNSHELRDMWKKAIKAALVVPVLVILKVIFSKLNMPPLFQAFTYGSIYAVGFVIIHIIGGALATKQPAMTASTLAAAMDNSENSEEAVDNLLEAVIRTLRTQVAALLGNYLFAFPIAVLLVFPFLATGHPVIGFEKAHHMLEELHPTRSLSLLYAAMAGVCLFLSGLVSGLADNWFAFNQIGDRMDTILSGPRGKKFVNALRKNFGVWTGNIALGFMLGSAAAVGMVTGLPIDIRHVTFSSGAFGIAWIHQEHMLTWSSFFLIAGTVLCLGIINLSVSFSLSLFVAMKSRRLRFRQGRRLLWLLIKRLLSRPHELFVDSKK